MNKEYKIGNIDFTSFVLLGVKKFKTSFQINKYHILKKELQQKATGYDASSLKDKMEIANALKDAGIEQSKLKNATDEEKVKILQSLEKYTESIEKMQQQTKILADESYISELETASNELIKLENDLALEILDCLKLSASSTNIDDLNGAYDKLIEQVTLEAENGFLVRQGL
jgi:hypothetical protein